MNPEDINYNKRYTRNIKVYVQIKPSEDLSWENVKLVEDRKSVYVRYLQDFGKGNLNPDKHYWLFHADHIFYNSKPEDLYENVTEGLLEKALGGNNVVIIAYGQTGTGKSTTVNGLYTSYKNRGIALRIISELLELKEKYQKESKIGYHTSCVEIKKTHIVDILSTEKKKIFSPFKNVTKLAMDTLDDGYRTVFLTEVNRTIFSNAPYNSHVVPCILTIYIKNVSLLSANPVDKFSKVHIIDMSGADHSGNKSCLFKKSLQIGAANLGKTQLEQLLLIYQKHQTKNDKLIRGIGCLIEYLSDSLKPHNLLRFITHINTSREDLFVTLSHMRFVHIAMCIAPAKLIPTIKTSEELEIENMKNHLNYYIHQNYLDSMLKNSDFSKNVSLARAEQMRNALDDYINDKSSNIALLNVSDAQIALDIFKKIHQQVNKDLLDNLNEKDEEILKLKQELNALLTPSKLSKASSEIKSKQSSVTMKKSRRSNLKNVDKATDKSRKSSTVGYVDPHGKSIGKQLSSNITSRRKSSTIVRNKSKTKSSTKTSLTPRESTDTTNQELESCSKMKSHDEAWSLFTTEEGYEIYQVQLTLATTAYKNTMDSYNEQLKKIQTCNQMLETKREYQMKIQFYRDSKQVDCCFDEDAKLNEIEKKIEESIATLNSELKEMKETLLTLQGELKINCDNYHRIKNELNDTFVKYCMEHFGINLGDIPDSFDEQLLTETEIKVEEPENPEIELFYNLQTDMFMKLEKLEKEKKKQKM